MVGAIATLAASLTVKSGGDSLRLDPGTELRAKVEASLPNNVLRLSVGKATVEVRASGPLPPGTELTLKVSGEPGRPQIQLLPDARPQGTPPPSSPAGNTTANTPPPASTPPGGGAPAQGAQPLPTGGPATGQVITPETTRQLLQAVARPPATGSAPAQGASQTGNSGTTVSTGAVRSDLAARAIRSISTPPPTGGQGTPAAPQSPAGNALPTGSRPAPSQPVPPQPASVQPAPQSGPQTAPSGSVPSGPAVSTTAPPPQSAAAVPPSTASQTPPSAQGTGAPAQAAASPTSGGGAPSASPAGSTPLPANLQAQALGSAPPPGGPTQTPIPTPTQAAPTQAVPGQQPGPANPAGPQPAPTQPAPAPATSGQPAPTVSGSTGGAQPLPSQALQAPTQSAAPQANSAAPAQTAAAASGAPSAPGALPGRNAPVQAQAPAQPAPGQGAQPPTVPQASAPQSAPPPAAAQPATTGVATASGAASALASGSPAGSQSATGSPAGLPAGAYSAARAAPAPGAESQSRPVAPQLQKAVDVVLPRLSEQQAGLSGVFAQIGTLMGGTSTAGANLPEPVKQVMQQILGLRLQPQSDGLSGKSVEAAVKNAGLMREAALLGGARAGGTPPPGGDLKSLLMNLKGLLSDLGARSAPLKPLVQPAIPSLKRSPQAERPASSSSILADGDEKALLTRLAQDTDAALARIRMTQLVNRGLAGDDPAVQGRAMDVTLELPVSVGEQTAVLQMQIGRDPQQEGADEEGEGAWRLRFALDLEETGPMEAAVSLRGGGTYVSLWIDRGETLEAFNANKESLEASFAHAGLDLRELRFLRGLPRRTEARFGAVVDRQS